MDATTGSGRAEERKGGCAKPRSSIGWRMLVVGAVGLCGVAAVAACGAWSCLSLPEQFHAMASANDATHRSLAADALFASVRADVFAALAAAYRGELSERSRLESQLAGHLADLHTAAAPPLATMQGSAGVTPKAVQDRVAAFEHAALATVRLSFAGDPSATTAVASLQSASAALQETLGEIIRAAETARRANAETAALWSRDARYAWIAGAAAALLLVIGLCAYARQAILRPLRVIHAAMIALARGDSTPPLPGMGSNTALRDMAEAVGLIRDSLREKETRAAETAATEDRLASERTQTVQATAEALQSETRTAVEFVTARSRQAMQDVQAVSQQTADAGERAALIAKLTEGAQADADRMAGSADQLALVGEEVKRDTSQANQLAQDAGSQVELAISAVEELLDSSKGFAQLIAVIDNVAERTDLVALHAMIEATRAGDAGKGFVVLAEEVQTLATKTTATTEDLIVGIESVQSAADRSLHALRMIGGAVGRLQQLASSLAGAMAQQTETAYHIAAGLRQTGQDTHKANRSAQDIARDAETSRALAANLEGTIEDIGGSIAELRRTLNRIVRTSFVEAERRRWPRRPACDPVAVFFEGHRIEGHLVDISGGGARVALDSDVPDGARIEVVVSRDNRAIPARIVQHFEGGKEMGIAFDQPISDDRAAA